MIKLSASSIRTFKACPLRFLYNYIYRLRKIEKTESQRIGTNWHKCMEILSWEPGAECPECKDKDLFQCPVCGVENGTLPDTQLEMIANYLDFVYDEAPIIKDPVDLAVERDRILYSLMGYLEYYNSQETDYETLATEVPFSFTLNAANGKPMRMIQVVGKIDRILKDNQDNFYIMEHKSTSSSIGPDSTYWGNLELDTQTLLYLYAAIRLARIGKIPGVPKDTVFKTLYDVWHKPRTNAKFLSQKDTKKFLETGKYYGMDFSVAYSDDNYIINGIEAEVKHDKKADAIKEIPAMYGARLLADIKENPHKHFVRKAIPRNQNVIETFEDELRSIAKIVMHMKKYNLWYRNERQCEATFKCDFIDFCYARHTIEPDEVPDGFEVKGK